MAQRWSGFILFTAHLAFIAMFFQVLAIDHWGAGFGDVFGVEGTSVHIHLDHCHGGGGNCGDGSASAGVALTPEGVRLPGASIQTTGQNIDNSPVPESAFISLPDQPPQPLG